jgi:hypothetical protein
MRNLNNRQKKAIEKWVEESLEDNWAIFTIDQMDEDDAKKILAMNDHETFWQNADRFITDLLLKNKYGKKT